MAPGRARPDLIHPHRDHGAVAARLNFSAQMPIIRRTLGKKRCQMPH